LHPVVPAKRWRGDGGGQTTSSDQRLSASSQTKHRDEEEEEEEGDVSRRSMQSPSVDAAVNVSMKGWRVQQGRESKHGTHQRAHWSGRGVWSRRAGRKLLSVWLEAGPKSDAPMVRYAALDGSFSGWSRTNLEFGPSGLPPGGFLNSERDPMETSRKGAATLS